MEAPATSEKKSKPRRVFGRLTREIEGRRVRFEMRNDGLHVKSVGVSKKKNRVMTFTQLRDYADGQKQLL